MLVARDEDEKLCGADANPEPRDIYEATVAHGHEMAAAVESVQSLGPPLANLKKWSTLQ